MKSIIFTLLIVYSFEVQPAIYKIIDKKGVIHLTDRPNEPQYRGMKRIRLTRSYGK